MRLSTMKKLLVSVVLIVAVLTGLRLFGMTAARPMTAEQLYLGMAAGERATGIVTTRIVKSPEADNPVRPEGSNVTQRLPMPPMPTPTPPRLPR